MTVSAEHQDAGAEPGVMIQPWPQHSAQILMAWRGVTSTTRVRANPLFCERHKGAMFPSSESSGLTWFLLTRASFLSLSVLSVRYLHISAQLTPEALPAPEANSCELQNKGDHPQGWGLPASSQPQGALEMPAGEQGPHSTWDAFLPLRSFSICHGGALQTLCSATCLPENVKAGYPHHLWNLAETNLSNQGRSAFGNKTKMV